jgi:hypothetical protein
MRLFLLSMEREEHDYGNGWDEDDIDWNDGSELERVHFCFDASGRSVPYVSRYAERLAPLSNHSFDDVDFWGVATHTEAYLNLGNEGASRTTSYAVLCAAAGASGRRQRARRADCSWAASRQPWMSFVGRRHYRVSPNCAAGARDSRELEWIAERRRRFCSSLPAPVRNDCALELLRTLDSARAVQCGSSVCRIGGACVASEWRRCRCCWRRFCADWSRKLTSGAVADVLNQFSEPFEAVRAVLEAVDAASSIASEDGAALAQALARVAHASIVEPIGRLLLVLQGSDERLECIRALWDHADAGALRPMLLDTMRAHPLADVPHAVALLQLCCALIDDEQLIDSVVVERVLAPERRSTLLMPLIEELIKLNVNNDALHRLCRARIDDLERLLAPGAPVLSWALPVDVYGVDRADLQAFVRDSRSARKRCCRISTAFIDARSAARRWSCAMRLRCVASGAGKHARVSVEKTHSAHQAAVDAYQRNVAEKQRLEQWMQVARGASRKRARAVDIDNKDEQHDA